VLVKGDFLAELSQFSLVVWAILACGFRLIMPLSCTAIAIGAGWGNHLPQTDFANNYFNTRN
jgi:hypothetical protein